MTRDQAESFARQWAGWWNSGEVERVLACFGDDTVFTSPTAADVVGTPTVRGKEALRTYWTTALARLGAVHFTVDRVVWDAQARELAVIYTARMAGRAKRVSENFRFDECDRIVSAEVFHGVTGAA
jgi:ketosteroid isomerase-like protein